MDKQMFSVKEVALKTQNRGVEMASNATKNTIGILALTEGCAIMVFEFYRNRPRNKTITEIVRRITAACKEANGLWRDKLTQAEVGVLGRVMSETEKQALSGLGDTEDITTYSSLILGLLADVLECVKDPVRHSMLEKIHSAVKRLHLYFDRDLNDWSAYVKASRACCVWHARMGC
ncbi:MAG: hypothetical protein ACP5IL_16930 [Syntrophobacteraceae bacterium]